MSSRRIVLTAVISIVVIAAVVAGGFAIYRYGYVRGAAESFGGPMMREFAGQFGDGRGMPYHEFNGEGDFHQRMPMLGYAYPGLRGPSAFTGLGSLLLIIGVGALVVIAINGFRGAGSRVDPVSDKPADEPKPKRRAS